MSIVVTTRDTDTGDVQTVTLQPGQFVVICAEPAHVVSDDAYATGRNCVWVKRNRDATTKTYKLPRGICPVCDRPFSLNSNGGTYAHDNPRPPGAKGWQGQCPGSRKAPKKVIQP